MIYIIIVAIVLIPFILRNDKRPEKCECEHYNFFLCGPVNRCPAHKHFME